MKTFKHLSLLLIVFALILGSCKKDDEDEDSGNYYFNVSIDGEKYHLDNGMSDIDDGGGNLGGTLKDDASNSKTVNIHMYANDLKSKGAGTYTPTISYHFGVTDSQGAHWYYSAGSFEVTKLNLENWTVKGTFNNVTLTNGVQNIQLKDGSFYLFLYH